MKYVHLFAVAFLAACASHPPAPVLERTVASTETTASRPGTPVPVGGDWYTVKKGDTLYSIALEHGRDYKDVAAWNNIDNPNRIRVGQQLRVSPPEGEEPIAVAKPIQMDAAPAAAKPPAGANTDSFKREPKGGVVAYSDDALARMREPAQQKPAEKPAEKQPPVAEKAPPPAGEDAVDWTWPAPGKTVAGYSESGPAINKGIDIAGKAGDPVYAAAAGKVVYVGSGLRGYGNLVIVRHNASYLSAYAHNSKILVKETQTVAKGQKIAEIGSSDADQAGLHFEIRRLGKPVDPLNYLPAR
ncbi:MAG TPA: peptidoglycan DD-metalloendopeptidase family protein [Rhodocyclaceae bacterium]